MTLGRTVTLVAAIVVWSALAYLFVFVFAGNHACSILEPVGVELPSGPVPSRDAAYYATLAARCDRPDIGAIAVFGAGYLGLASVAIWSLRHE